jgi:hypothetical protein
VGDSHNTRGTFDGDGPGVSQALPPSHPSLTSIKLDF